MWARKTVGFKMTLVYALAFTLGAFGFLSGLYAINAVSTSNRQLIEKDFATLDVILELRTALAQQIGAAREYIVTPDAATLKLYRTAHLETHKFLAEARVKAGAHSGELDELERAKQGYDAGLEKAIALADQGNMPGAASELQRSSVTGFDAKVFALEQRVESKAKSGAAISRRFGSTVTLFSLFLGLAMFVVAFGGGLVLNRLLTSLSRELNRGSSRLTTSSDEIASASEEVSRGVEAQLTQVVDTSSAMEEMSTSIKEVSRSAQGASAEVQVVSDKVNLNAAKISEAVDGVWVANDSLIKLKARSEQIGQVIKLIGEIAAQTNMLALNAAIEAARAGEHGKGFDVVAEEIRKLALRTSQSTTEVAPIIAGLQKETQETAELVGKEATLASEVGASFSEIVVAISSATSKAQAISTAAVEQAKAAEQIADSLQVISGAGREAARSAENTAAATSELAGLAGSLRQLTRQLKAS